MELILICVGTFILGILVGRGIYKRPSAGKLHVINDEQNETYLFLELDTNVENVVSRDYVTFKVTQK